MQFRGSERTQKRWRTTSPPSHVGVLNSQLEAQLLTDKEAVFAPCHSPSSLSIQGWSEHRPVEQYISIMMCFAQLPCSVDVFEQVARY